MRNLHRAFDVGQHKPRLSPLLAAIDDAVARISPDIEPVGAITWLQKRVEGVYGRCGPSLASKVLWFVCRDPIVIYDDYVRRALKVRAGDYAKFHDAWMQRYGSVWKEIRIACEPVCDEEWFRQRVFDSYLWPRGREMKRSRGHSAKAGLPRSSD